MALTQEQTGQIKEQLFQQIESSNLPNKDEIRQQIQNMNEEQLEEFLKQQQAQQPQTESSPQGSQCIFCSIINNDVPSNKIAENKKAIAILEINPVSKGHSLIIPIEHSPIEKLPASVLELAKKVAKKIKSKLKPEDIKIETSNFQGHAIVNIIPIYKDEKLEKKKAETEELEELQKQLETKKRGSRTLKIKTQTKSNLPKISFRIP